MNNEALEHWKSKTKVFPDKFSSLEYSRDFTVEEYGKIAKGVIPLEMEDKWFIHLEDDTLNLYRSWTGHCIYKVRLEKTDDGYCISEVKSNRDPNQYRETDGEYDAKMLDFLISNLLLGGSKPFPRKSDTKEPLSGVVQHHVAGTGYPEIEYPEKKPWWKFWK